MDEGKDKDEGNIEDKVNNYNFSEEESVFYFISEDGSKKYGIHKGILNMESSAFEELVNMSENIVFQNEDEDAIKDIIRYFNTHENNVDEDNIIFLKKTKELAEKYENTKLKELCVEKISNISLKFSNVYSLMKLSSEFLIEEKERACIEFISKNLEKVLYTEQFKEVPFKEILDILIKLKINNKISESEFLNQIFKCINVNDPETEIYEKLILENIDLTMIPEEDCLNIIQSYSGYFLGKNIFFILLKKVFSELQKHKTVAESMIEKVNQQEENLAEIRVIIQEGVSELELQRNAEIRNLAKIQRLQDIFEIQVNRFQTVTEVIDGEMQNINREVYDEKNSMIYIQIDRCMKLTEEVQNKVSQFQKRLEEKQQNSVNNQMVCIEMEINETLKELKQKVDQLGKEFKHMQSQINHQQVCNEMEIIETQEDFKQKDDKLGKIRHIQSQINQEDYIQELYQVQEPLRKKTWYKNPEEEQYQVCEEMEINETQGELMKPLIEEYAKILMESFKSFEEKLIQEELKQNRNQLGKKFKQGEYNRNFRSTMPWNLSYDDIFFFLVEETVLNIWLRYLP